MGCVVSAISCCFCNAAAALCCSCLPSCKSSTSSKIMYCVVLLTTMVISLLMMTPGIKGLLAKIPFLCSSVGIGSASVNRVLNCDLITGYGAVYRVCFATSIFFITMALIMINVKSSKDFRSYLQNGFWFFKFIAILGIIIGAFYIPTQNFIYAWMIIGIIGGCLYILIQLILLVDFAHSWNENWITKYADTSNSAYLFGVIFCTSLFYALSFAGLACYYIYYASDPACTSNKVLISFNFIACIIVTAVSVLPQIQEELPKSGLLQSSLVTLYVMFLTWSSMNNSQDVRCNPTLFVKNQTHNSGSEDKLHLTFSWNTVFSIAFLLLSVCYSCIKNSSWTLFGRLSESETCITSDSGPELREAGQTVWDDEKCAVTYSYSAFHCMLFLATLYVMVSLTQWYSLSDDLLGLVANSASYWVKAASSWVCLVIYFWTLIAPKLLSGRTFA